MWKNFSEEKAINDCYFAKLVIWKLSAHWTDSSHPISINEQKDWDCILESQYFYFEAVIIYSDKIAKYCTTLRLKN